MLSPDGIAVILFDLDGTLRHNQPSSEHAFFDYAVQLGVEDSPERRREAMRWSHYYWAQSQLMLEDVEETQASGENFWDRFCYRHLLSFGCGEDQARELAPVVNKLMEEAYKPEDVVLPETFATLNKLRESGYRLGIVTNRTNPCDEQLLALGLTPYFETTIIAGSVAAWKPDPAIFKHAFKSFEIEPHQALYVGDNYYADVIGARRAGIQPVLIDPEGIFPDPDCPVIHKIPDLERVLEEHRQSSSCASPG